MATYDSGLIYDVGAHVGEDTEFYLKKGFKVVAVEANPDLAAGLRNRFAGAVADGRLVVVEKAIAGAEGEVTFFVNDKVSVWGTISAEWAERNEQLGAPSRRITVPATTFAHLLEEHGVPYYLKIDIEGADMECLRALLRAPARPAYLSIESNKISWAALMEEFETLKGLGYTRFKVINQKAVPRQKEPQPALEGVHAGHRFAEGASGLFGKELPGGWLSADEAIARYRSIFLHYRFAGDNTAIEKIIQQLPRPFGRLLPGWYDTHAALN